MRAAVITISDSRSIEDDGSGNVLISRLAEVGAEISIRRLVTDDALNISQMLESICDREDIDVVFTTGGTGFGPRDNTPEATRAVIEREAPGLAEAMRRETAAKHPMAMLSRGVCGIRGRTLIINLPGSPRGVEECFEVIKGVLPHAVELMKGNTRHLSK